MKVRTGFIAVVLIALFCLKGYGQDLPRLSPLCKMSQKIGLTEISLEYSRPSTKGREIFGGLVPYNQVWRAGANACTKVTFSTDVVINGKELPKGTYGLFVIPNKDSWKVSFNSNFDQWGSTDYDSELDVLATVVKPETTEYTETFTFEVSDIKSETADLTLKWADTKVNIPISVPVLAMADENIKEKLEEIQNPYFTYFNIARYYLGVHENKKGLEYAKMAAETSGKYWVLKLLSEAYAANLDYKLAVKEGKKALSAAKKAGDSNYTIAIERNINAWSQRR
ncbi:DUF2911 domain-containing protein [Aureibacter tunicatorum]|uniref:DUF2911 domain-containing protein n=1 Tax=Aureibacter tunicatorum TaxID=866807 RepID=A0AAE3XQ67_9BACT|nr:DUF2911 domain-containing protein [Aureibacter tunicatorum]MDR6239911.1 hypothetical protein [Aureibacter tunicatorum]BDD04386.1 hypothetical protein AUTU_18690 [Aureibacter tunicatorum]